MNFNSVITIIVGYGNVGKYKWDWDSKSLSYVSSSRSVFELKWWGFDKAVSVSLLYTNLFYYRDKIDKSNHENVNIIINKKISNESDVHRIKNRKIPHWHKSSCITPWETT